MRYVWVWVSWLRSTFVHTQWNTWNQTTSLQQNKKWSAPSTTASWNWSSMVNASAILAQKSKNHEPWMLLPSLPKKLTCLVQLKLTLMPVRTNNCTRDTMRFREQKSHAKCANMKLVRVWNVSSLMTTTQSCVLVSGHLPAAIVGYTHEEGWYRREKKTDKITGAQCSRLQTLARDQRCRILQHTAASRAN